MVTTTVLDEDRVKGSLPLGALATSISAALIAVSDATASVPPRIAARSPEGLLAAMPGYVPGLGLAAKLVSVFAGNPTAGLPSHQALVVVFDESTGEPLALLGATHLTAVRTAVASAVAARALARPDATSLAILGAGVQGRAHLEAVSSLVAVSEVRVASRDRSKAERLAGSHPGARAVGSFAEAVSGADIVCCCTDAPLPVIEDRWVGPGAHVGSVGIGAELPAGLLGRSRVFVESTAVTAAPPAGAVELQGRDPSTVTEIGAVLAGRSAGRTDPAEVTVWKSVGHAALDVAAAVVALRHAEDPTASAPPSRDGDEPRRVGR